MVWEILVLEFSKLKHIFFNTLHIERNECFTEGGDGDMTN